MITEGMQEAIKRHKERGHEVHVAQDGSARCATCGSILAWQVVDTRNLSAKNRDKLFVFLPMRYASDSDAVDRFLMENGFETVSDTDFAEALEAAKRHLQESLPPGYDGRRRG